MVVGKGALNIILFCLVKSHLTACRRSRIKKKKGLAHHVEIIFLLLKYPHEVPSDYSSISNVCKSLLSVMRGELRAPMYTDRSLMDRRSLGDYIHWSYKRGLWFQSTAAPCLMLCSVISGAEGAVFSKSVETPHVRAEPFKELRWVCVYQRTRWIHGQCSQYIHAACERAQWGRNTGRSLR